MVICTQSSLILMLQVLWRLHLEVTNQQDCIHQMLLLQLLQRVKKKQQQTVCCVCFHSDTTTNLDFLQHKVSGTVCMWNSLSHKQTKMPTGVVGTFAPLLSDRKFFHYLTVQITPNFQSQLTAQLRSVCWCHIGRLLKPHFVSLVFIIHTY